MVLLSILAMFILPLALAIMMYNGSIPYKSETTRNLGNLVVPAIPIDWSGAVTADGQSADHMLNGFWVILYALPAACAQPCLDLITGLRQVHRASGQYHDQIRIALLFDPTIGILKSRQAELHGIYARFNLISDASPTFSRALELASSKGATQDWKPAIFLVDPYGNIMMTYNGDGIPNKLNKDLKRLLTWSKLDKRS